MITNVPVPFLLAWGTYHTHPSHSAFILAGTMERKDHDNYLFPVHILNYRTKSSQHLLPGSTECVHSTVQGGRQVLDSVLGSSELLLEDPSRVIPTRGQEMGIPAYLS